MTSSSEQAWERTRMRVSDGIEVWLDVGLDDARQAWHKAAAGSHMLEVKGKDGSTIVVNPNQVLYLEETGTHDDRALG